jgi:hypothetical protein
MADEETSAYRDLEKRVRKIETDNAGRDVRVEIAITTMNRLAVLVGSAGVAILGAVVAFVLTGSHS